MKLNGEAGEILAEEHVALLNANLATKADIAIVNANIDALRQETRASIEAVKSGPRERESFR